MANRQTSSAHTPGPWRTDSIGTDRVWILDSDGNYLAEIVAKDESGFAVPTDQQEANARLMAKAPRLLASCKSQLQNWKDLHSGEWDGSEEGILCAIENLEAVIAEAEGR